LEKKVKLKIVIRSIQFKNSR